MGNLYKHLILILMTVVTSVSASAQDLSYDGFLCEIHGGFQGPYISITGFDGDCPSVLEIPEEVQFYGTTYPVTSIDDYAFSECNALTSVSIPNSITKIGQGAFNECSSLASVYISDLKAWCNIYFKNVWANPLINGASLYLNGELVTDLVIPDSITTIFPNAFAGYTKLTSITIPNTITKIWSGAFTWCRSLTSVYISDLEAWYNIDFVDYNSNPLCNYASLYLNGELVTDVIFPKSVTTIKPYAFNGCISLTSVTIPESVTEIGEYAFGLCANLPSVTIPNSVTEIGEYAFKGCSFTSITIPNSVTEIKAGTFMNCSSLTSVTIPASVTKIGENAFGWCFYISSVYISDLEAWCNIEFHYTSNPLIGGASLYLNGELVTDLIIPESVTTIKPYTFYDCSSLTSVTIPNSVTEIGEGAFESCHNLSCMTIPDSVTEIGERAFQCCCGLTSLTIGESVSEIDATAFYICDNLSIINIRAKTLPTIAPFEGNWGRIEDPFEDVVYENATLYVPAGCGEAYKAAQGWSNFKNIVEGEFSGIDEVTSEESVNEIVGYYNAQGAMSNEPWQGLNIVVYSDGSHRKVIF